ncbi:MAG: serine/threonine protein kinase [Planctomycetales bacterium]|nr:serine/threonine protein kinase [Planctomycetales bacterium]
MDKLRSLFGESKLDVHQKYELLREAVHGTMSAFHMARDKHTDEIVGLKICDLQKTESFEGRFASLKKPSEGEIASQFEHPRIVKTIAFGTTTNDEHYVLMEYLDGIGLNSLIHQKSEALDGKRVPLIRQMAEALSYVHESGFIHRDVCPRNFICNHELTEIKLIDFGLTVPAQKEYMQPGNRTGTPSYMAPEIVRRRATDQRLDIFAFGVTVYQMCTYQLPWPGQDVSGKAAVSHDTKPPTDIFEVQPNLNRRLGETIMACLAVDPSDRPQSMQEFLRRISAVEQEFAED